MKPQSAHWKNSNSRRMNSPHLRPREATCWEPHAGQAGTLMGGGAQWLLECSKRESSWELVNLGLRSNARRTALVLTSTGEQLQPRPARSMLKTYLVVMLGGAIGSGLRMAV